MVPKISDAEWEVMKIIWNTPNIKANEITKLLDDKKEWKQATVKSLINRLLKKNAISFEKDGKEYSYYALVTEEECVLEESQSFLNRVFNGSVSNMVVNLVKNQNLTEDDINELRKLLEKGK